MAKFCCKLEGSGILDRFYRFLYHLGEWLEDDLVVFARRLRNRSVEHFCGGDDA
jgi:hypothetical protein